MFLINTVFQHQDKTFRILKILSEHVVLINLNDSKAVPSLITRLELTQAIESCETCLIEDPYGDIALLAPDEGSTDQIKRDENYQLIKPLIDNEQFYIPSVRFAIVKEILSEKKSTHQTIYRVARRYWQQGQIPNALIPNYKNSGAKGIKRIAKENKLGRPRTNSEGIGALINDDIERLFSININKFMLTSKKHSLNYAHRKFQKMYRSLHPSVQESEIPTIWQFKHFYDREFSTVTKLKSRTNPIEYSKDIRALHSTVNTQVLGPGSRYEIDATIADIYLVSDSDRECIVGRPTIYFVADVFSRMIAGFYIGFENPSYVTSMQALKMAVSDKTEFCKQYGYDISSEDWPNIGLPDVILADRGELLGHQIETLEKSFSVRIENTPPYRGDLKPIVERYFRTIQAKFKPFVEGVVQKDIAKKRGGYDYRLDATLTITDFIQIILGSVLMHNQSHQLTQYDRDIDMPMDLPLVPVLLWNWGLQHRTGKLRSASEKALYIALLPRVKATLSDLGLKVFSVFYSCREIDEQGWLHRKKTVSRPSSFQVAYDPSNAQIVYVFYEDNSLQYWEASLSPRSREFIGCSFWEIWQVQQGQKKAAAKQSLSSNLAIANMEERNESIIKIAESKKPKTTQSQQERLAAIRSNREKAKNNERESIKQANTAKGYTDPDQIAQDGKIIKMPKRPKSKAEQDEELALRYPTYHDMLFDDENH